MSSNYTSPLPATFSAFNKVTKLHFSRQPFSPYLSSWWFGKDFQTLSFQAVLLQKFIPLEIEVIKCVPVHVHPPLPNTLIRKKRKKESEKEHLKVMHVAVSYLQ